jgi:mannosyl-3-phosphoglycerate phosphatase
LKNFNLFSPVPYKLVIFTDLDGTLLDKYTYQPGPSLKSLKKCRRLNIPVIFVSGKSKAEMELIRKELNNDSPFISENGGGLYIPAKDFQAPDGALRIGSYWCLRSNETIEDARNVLLKSAIQADIKVKSFNQFTASEVSELTGLNLKHSKLAKIREFDEAFVIVDETPEKLNALKEKIARHGYGYTHGGHLHHIMGNFDKGQRVQQAKELYLRINAETKFAAFGDAYNDLPMLKVVDYPYLVRKPDNTYDEAVVFKGLTITDGVGPAGFAEAVDGLIEELDLEEYA